MASPFPGMDPYVESNPLFQEIHTQMLSHAQAMLQPQLRPKYVARWERHLSEGSVWDNPGATVSLARKEPDLTIASLARDDLGEDSTARTEAGPLSTALPPTVSMIEELDPDEQQLRKQRRIVIYVNARPRLAVASIELLSPSNKAAGAVTRTQYLEKRSSALSGGLHWVEIDLLRSGQRPPIPLELPGHVVYLAQAALSSRRHLAYGWALRDPLPTIPIPLLGNDHADLNLAACFNHAYDAVAAGEEVDYADDPPLPHLSESEMVWVAALLREQGRR